ncbi:class I SAM-dependent methyltransferase [Nitrogeniibacter mangrovi]|uniref:Class I SAM-dependent methyltransferase n=1 Tax=Nitrogeniibacter mangrovi TaxID=2016596 RepID=A0A6C1B2P8_9RHOO|nr:class I SAM-dependent methyltransferase [Nitrogeniibacter mangrovi]QID17653.1 class I SAM-dependent methyltransferase [Nitrogeniibacter mangrovi]
MSDPDVLEWSDEHGAHRARWRSAAAYPPPARVRVVDDTLGADAAWSLACEGTALLWQGDYHNARQLLTAMARRAGRRKRAPRPPDSITQAFHLHRQAQAQRARALGMLLVPLAADFHLPLRRAPEVSDACRAAWGEADGPCVVSLRELLGVIGAHQWQLKGVEVPALGARIHPVHGVFSPVRGEYVDLVAQAPLPATTLAIDIGTGTGVLAALLVRRGVQRVIAVDQDARALACAADNLARLGVADRVELRPGDLFPEAQAPLIVCNPPWVPAKPTAAVEAAVYDPDSRMLRGFLAGLAAHLSPGGEGWLILSDLAEHLGLRSRETLLGWIGQAGLRVEARLDIRPRHAKVGDADDPLHAARAAELTSLWRLKVA